MGSSFVIFCFIVATVSRSAYSNNVHQKVDELALVGYQLSTGVQSERTFFVRYISMRSHFMAKLGRDIFICAGHLLSLSTNPFQLCHPHLVVNGKAPLIQQERIHHAS
ncbi:hypothetical protein [Acinetobacter pseudolwoffii]|uniref:hypothetical protein n=1 Tax=Acinetobacter pseudolwoffii TaxID=2053287 RepID=UPI00148E23DC|nr:hypothetical protein [Acinetobacter pseudolwoffii]